MINKQDEKLLIIPLLLILILLFCAILIPREIPFLKTISVLARYNTTRFVPAISIILLISLSLKNFQASITLTAIFIFSALALTLNGLWAGAYTENNVIAGLVPRTDAFSFYGGAVSLIEKGHLVGYAQRRPLFGSLLGFILWLTKGNLQITLAILTFLISTVILLSVMEVRNILSAPATVLFFLVVFMFARRQIGITMSETLGFMLGCLALLIFLIFLRQSNDNHQGSEMIFLFAVAIFSLAQASRPGAVATLPLLILYSGWVFYKNKRKAWLGILICSMCILSVFAINSGIFQLITLGGSQINNIGYGIYALVSGGKGWKQIFIDHPSIAGLPPGEFERQIFHLIWESLINHPEKFFQGMVVQFRILFSFQPTNSLFSYAWSKNSFISYGFISLLFIFSLLSIFAVFFEKRDDTKWLFLIFILGIFLSLPFAPAYQQQYMRLYAVSIPFFAFFAAYGLHFAISLLPQKYRMKIITEQPSQSQLSTGFSLFTAMMITIVVFASPIVTSIFAPSTIPQTAGCDEDQTKVIMPYYPGSGIKIYRNDPAIKTWVPIISQLDYKGSIHSICCGPEILYFENIPAPNVIYPALNLLTSRTMYLITDESLLPDEYGLIQVCGRIEDVYKQPSEEGFLYPQSIQFIQ